MVGRPWRVSVGQEGGQKQHIFSSSASLAARTRPLSFLAPTCSHRHLKSSSCLPPHHTHAQKCVSYGNQGRHGLQTIGADLRQPGLEQRPRTAASQARARSTLEEKVGELGCRVGSTHRERSGGGCWPLSQ